PYERVLERHQCQCSRRWHGPSEPFQPIAMLDINLEVDPQHDEDRWPKQHEPEVRHRPGKRHAYLFTATQERAVRSEQGQKSERRRSKECQPNASDLRGGLIDRLVDEISGGFAQTPTLTTRYRR